MDKLKKILNAAQIYYQGKLLLWSTVDRQPRLAFDPVLKLQIEDLNCHIPYIQNKTTLRQSPEN